MCIRRKKAYRSWLSRRITACLVRSNWEKKMVKTVVTWPIKMNYLLK